jgi:hypothetical protein
LELIDDALSLFSDSIREGLLGNSLLTQFL